MPFRAIRDAFIKVGLLKEIYEKVEKMNIECKKIFDETINCLLQRRIEYIREIADEDKIINKYEVEIRNDILNYLAINRAPDLNAALILTSIVISYERIGDYCKGIANLYASYPCVLEKDEYMEIILQMRTTIEEQIELTRIAFKECDTEKARKVVDSYGGIKTLHQAIIEKLNKDTQIKTNNAITYACLSMYLRRISAHLKNTSTAILYPFPEIGFEKKTDIS